MEREGSQDSFDIHAPDGREEIECQWAAMREQDGLYHSALYGGFFVAARYEDVMTVLMNPDRFRSGKGITLPPPDAIRSRHIPAETDPPEHGEYRRIMQPMFSAARARALEPVIRSNITELLDRMPSGRSFDFVEYFAKPLPIWTALDLMRLPRDHAAELERMVDDLHKEVATGEATGAAERMKTFAQDVLEMRRKDAADPDSDVVSAILHGEAFGRKLTAEEQMSMVRLILVGGFDTTSMALASMAAWLARDCTAMDRLRGNPAAIDTASEEIVRFSSPSTYLRREVSEDCELGGTRLKQGDSVLIAFGAANRDPARFACPDRVIADRKPNPHVGFGAGRHRCIGSFVGKAQIRIAVEEILNRFDRIEVDGSAPAIHSHGLGQGLSSLTLSMSQRLGQSAEA